ncbi:MAG: aminopeptidase P N-terminal domain-containing protein [Myxococcales bacterium]|nr:aminopeptidase P N-terminal domain-containing protein [Polyangiaceae bacterium]MDW8249304.1 aminopeptidase P N-terminal domain-containing protein [Myxococcales bacterium]
MLFHMRRAAVAQAMGTGVMVLFSAPVAYRNRDVEHEYRQDSDFYYLTGFDEPESAAVLLADEGRGRLVMFVRPRHPERDVWDGRRVGVEGARELHGADEAFPIQELNNRLPELLRGRRRLFHRLGRYRDRDDLILWAIDTVRARGRSPYLWPTEIVDPEPILHEMRWRKDEGEVRAMQRAADVTCEGHLAAMRRARPGGYEYEVDAALREAFRRLGSERCAYPPIVGAGANGTTLHYRANSGPLRDGDLLLVDAGAEVAYYASDVTRTFPINGRFSPDQRAAYEVVLAAQEAAIARCVPGSSIEDVHAAAVELLVVGMVRLGLLRGEPQKLIEEGAYRRYFMHRTSHYLGMDVHDVGAYFIDQKPRLMEPGVVLTVEPGLYISPQDEDAPPGLRGLGIRIEDDVLITPAGPRVLTAEIPRKIEDVEAACR